jgi:hypothetical protein
MSYGELKHLHTNYPEGARIGVWIDQDLDATHGLPVEICGGKVFGILKQGDGFSTYTHQDGKVLGPCLSGIVVVPQDMEDLVIEAAEEQPEENIFTEYVKVDAAGAITGFWDIVEGVWVDWVPIRRPLEGTLEGLNKIR